MLKIYAKYQFLDKYLIQNFKNCNNNLLGTAFVDLRHFESKVAVAVLFREFQFISL